MGRFGQPRYKDPAGTPVALRGIREVTDKNKHILLEAIFNGDFVPDHLLPVGIHRCGQQRWRAHLCTVGHKFSGPPRENVRDACEDRRKFCEENGVNFVLYGKQTHAKGPIGSRPVVPSVFPRLSDYVTTMSRSSTGGAGNSQMVLAGLKSNSAMKPFFDAVEDAKKVLKARKAEEDGTASYVVTPSVGALHRRIIEDAIDKREHVYSSMRGKRKQAGSASPFQLCPIKIQHGGVMIRFVWSCLNSLDDPTLYVYLESILCNTNPPLSDHDRDAFIQKVIDTDVASQVAQFHKLNEKVSEVLGQFNSLTAGIKFAQQHAPHTVHTRKNNIPPAAPVGPDPTSPVIPISLTPTLTVDWNVLTPDALAEEYAKQLENEQDLVAASDILFTLLDFSTRQRMSLLHVQTSATKKQAVSKTLDHTECHANFSEDDLVQMNEDMGSFADEELARCLWTLASLK